jgi:uncharacterized protein (TIGR01777 family)
MKTIGITGGTGFVGRHLTSLLASKGYRVVIFTRSAGRQASGLISYARWDPKMKICESSELNQLDGVIHLAGEAIAEKRLTENRKKEIIESRINSTEFLLGQLEKYAPNCKTFIAASATGFYGPDRPGSGPFDEEAPPFTDFLADTCKQWEDATSKAGARYRTAIIRIGIVLGKEGGAFPKLSQPLSLGVMPVLGSGTQMVSWIDVDDLAKMFLFALENENIRGVYNGTAPAPVSHRELMQTIAKAKGGWKIPVPVPSFLLKIMVGEMSEEVLKSCTVSAQKIKNAGFVFDFPDIKEAIHHCFS